MKSVRRKASRMNTLLSTIFKFCTTNHLFEYVFLWQTAARLKCCTVKNHLRGAANINSIATFRKVAKKARPEKLAATQSRGGEYIAEGVKSFLSRMTTSAEEMIHRFEKNEFRKRRCTLQPRRERTKGA